MGEGYTVEPEQLRDHATNLETVKARFDAVNSASSHIAQDDEAYGLLCGWIAGVLEDKHARQDELVDYVAENLGLAAEAVRGSAEDYEDADGQSGTSFNDLQSQIGN